MDGDVDVDDDDAYGYDDDDDDDGVNVTALSAGLAWQNAGHNGHGRRALPSTPGGHCGRRGGGHGAATT